MSEQSLPKAEFEGNLPIGEVTLRVAVLGDGIRVISRNGMFQAFQRTHRGRMLNDKRVEGFPSFIDAQNLQPFIDPELARELTEFEYLSKSGKAVRRGFKAETLPLICDVYLRAREAGVLVPQQRHLAVASEIIVRSLAKVGIVALIDEATGYQTERAHDELQKILEAYISKELLPWTKRFPDEFYQQIYRLKGWPYNASTTKRTQLVGMLTNRIVYELLPPGVLDELRAQNPITEKGHRAHKHHQFLTIDIGNPNLEKHLSQLIVLMRISRDWQNFEDQLLKAFPRYGDQMKLDIIDEPAGDSQLHGMLSAGGRDGAGPDFDRALNRAANPR